MSRLTPALGTHDHYFGSKDAPVRLVEYGDYECPHCGRAHQIVKPLLAKLRSEVLFVFRNFPLAEAHPHAFVAAEAAEAAAAQGRFWPMHDLLFENQAALELDDLVAYAEAVGLDTERFLRDLTSNAHADRVQADFLSGVKSGVNGTPTFFIQGERYDGSWDAQSLLAAIGAVADSA